MGGRLKGQGRRTELLIATIKYHSSNLKCTRLGFRSQRERERGSRDSLSGSSGCCCCSGWSYCSNKIEQQQQQQAQTEWKLAKSLLHTSHTNKSSTRAYASRKFTLCQGAMAACPAAWGVCSKNFKRGRSPAAMASPRPRGCSILAIAALSVYVLLRLLYP